MRRQQLNLLKITVKALTATVVGFAAYKLYIWSLFQKKPAKPMKGKIHIACVGDSITYGVGVLKQQKTKSYPAYLQRLLGDKYHVMNFGLSGRTLLLEGDLPYIREKLYPKTFQCKPDIYIFMLGTNDAKPYNWHPESYKRELRVLLEKYIVMVGNRRVIVMKPPKAFIPKGDTEESFDISDKNVRAICHIIDEIAAELNIGVIDLYAITKNHAEWFKDGIHPDAEGNRHIAMAVFKELEKLHMV